MKKCPLCGTICSEGDAICGVCGTSLDQVKAESENDSSKANPLSGAVLSPARTLRDERRKQGTIGLLFGIGMIATGILAIQLIALVGFLMLLFGFTAIVTDISWMRGNTWYDQDEPIVHGRIPLRGYLSYPSNEDEKEKPNSETQQSSSSQRRDESKE